MIQWIARFPLTEIILCNLQVFREILYLMTFSIKMIVKQKCSPTFSKISNILVFIILSCKDMSLIRSSIYFFYSFARFSSCIFCHAFFKLILLIRNLFYVYFHEYVNNFIFFVSGLRLHIVF